MISLSPVIIPGFIGASYLPRLVLVPRQTVTELVTIVVLFAVRHHDWILHTSTIQFYHNYTPVIIYAVLSSTLCLVFCSLFSDQSTRGSRSSSDTSRKFDPLLFPCRTTHTRLFPKVHSFSYSYLYAGVPVGWTGVSGTLLSADTWTLSRSGQSNATPTAWFSVEAEDYLRRGPHEKGLLGKLREYLLTQDVDPDLYPYAYLVTAPRFLGFSFNPVSFWYLYRSDQKLGAMILEVNNTFDERRMYFMELADKSDASPNHPQPFKHSWPKDFHVSPFNSRDGSYSVTATDPFAPDMEGQGHVDVNIVLHAGQGNPKLIARVFSTGPPTITDQAKRLESFLFVCRWWWVGLMTNPRIVHEARKLWSKGLEVFYRPEVLLGSIGRRSTAAEAAIEQEFASLLDARATKLSMLVHYTPAAGSNSGLVQQLGAQGMEVTASPLILHVLSAAFYTEVARLNSSLQVVKQFGLVNPAPERLVHVSDITLCEKLLGEGKAATTHAQDSLFWSPLWSLLMVVKALNTDSLYPASITTVCKGRLAQYLSALDLHVRSEGKDARGYLRASLAILIGDRIAFGYPPLLKVYGLCLWLTACWFASDTLEMVTYAAGLSHHVPPGKAVIATVALHCLTTVTVS